MAQTSEPVFIDSRAAADRVSAALAQFAADHGLAYDAEIAEEVAGAIFRGGLVEFSHQMLLSCNLQPES